MAAAAKRIEVTARDRAELERIIESGIDDPRLVERARIVLAAAEGDPAARIADRLGCSEQTVLRWRSRYERLGVAGLRDNDRSGRPLVYGRDVRAALVALASTRPPETPGGRRRDRWTLRELAERVGMSESQVHAILRSADLHPR
jgi:transposase